MTIGKRITKYRKEESLSQEALADKLGITRQTLSSYENDITAPDLAMATKISEELKISLDDLVGNNSKDILYNKINHTEAIVKKQTRYITIVIVTLYFFLLISASGVGFYYLLNRDFTTSYQLEFSCYNKKENKNFMVIVDTIETPYEEYVGQKLDNAFLYESGQDSKIIENSPGNDNVLTKFVINMSGVYVHGGNSFHELINNLNTIKQIAIDQGYTCR